MRTPCSSLASLGNGTRCCKLDCPCVQGLEHPHLPAAGSVLGARAQSHTRRVPMETGAHLTLHSSPCIEGFRGCERWAICSELSLAQLGGPQMLAAARSLGGSSAWGGRTGVWGGVGGEERGGRSWEGEKLGKSFLDLAPPTLRPFPLLNPFPDHWAPRPGSGVPFLCRGLSPKSLHGTWRTCLGHPRTLYGPKSSVQDLRGGSVNPG